jgi:hypothetical protein
MVVKDARHLLCFVIPPSVFCYPYLLSHVLLSIPHSPTNFIFWLDRLIFRYQSIPQALVSFKKYMPPPLLYFKVNICPFPLPHFASIFFALFLSH